MDKLNPTPQFYDKSILVLFNGGQWSEYSNPVCVVPMSIMDKAQRESFKERLLELFNEYSVAAKWKSPHCIDEKVTA